MIPLQDAPGVKFTYEASVTVPAPLVVLMSATRLGEPDTNGTGADATLTYHFEQKQPLSSCEFGSIVFFWFVFVFCIFFLVVVYFVLI